MLTVDYDRLGVLAGDRVLDLGCGAGRHAYGALRRGADVVALDYSADEVATVLATFAAMIDAGEVPAEASPSAVRGDLLALPFPDESFDRVIAAEVLEHIPADDRAMAEIVRVLRPGGRAAVTVPRWFPERICWALSDDYHQNPGGHVRIYKGSELTAKLTKAGLLPDGSHHAHGLHAPYWWLKCAVGVERDHLLPRLYHRMLVWDITAQPAATRVVDRALNPLIGKSLVLYLHKPEVARVPA
jgi:SAM-dependent methyltransferase